MLSLSCALPIHAAASNDLRLVSLPSSTAASFCRSGAGGSFRPSISADGSKVVFLSQAHNLATNDPLTVWSAKLQASGTFLISNRVQSRDLSVLVRELVTEHTTRLNLGTNAAGEGEPMLGHPCISSNGQFVALDGETWGYNGSYRLASYAYLYDSTLDTASLASLRMHDGFVPPAGNARFPLISDDGRWVFFEGSASFTYMLLVGPQDSDVFVRDVWSNQTYVASEAVARSFNGTISELSAITPDGRFAAFTTRLASPNPPTDRQVYLRDMIGGATTLISSNVASDFTGTFVCANPVLSADGQRVAFAAYQTLESVHLYLYDLTAQTTTLVSPHASYPCTPQLSADGNWIAYEDGTNVFLWNVPGRTNLLISVNRDGSAPGNDFSHNPTMTPDGRLVVFVSAATDLTPNPANGLFQIYARDLVAGTTRLVSANTNGTACDADLELSSISLSADGRLVAFDSVADDLVEGDFNQSSDVFVRELNTGITRLVSERDPGLPAASAWAYSCVANSSCVSSNGSRLVFTSPDGSLVPGDTNGWPDVFVRDLSGATVKGLGFGTNAAGDQVISADGRFVAFTRKETNDPQSFFGDGKIYRCEVQTGTTELVTVTPEGVAVGLSGAPALSPDGRYVAFQSCAAGLVPQGAPATMQVFLRDMVLGTNLLISVSTNGNFGNNLSYGPTFSPDGRWLVFRGTARDLVTNQTSLVGTDALFVRDLLSNRTKALEAQLGFATAFQPAAFSPDSRWVVFAAARQASGGSWALCLVDLVVGTNVDLLYLSTPGSIRSPSVSSGGRSAAFEQRLDPPYNYYDGNKYQIMLFDRTSRGTTLISANQAGIFGGNNASTSPLLSSDGRFVVFSSTASDLVNGDTNAAADIFVRDCFKNTTMLVSQNAFGWAGNGASIKPVLAADGRTLVFQSFAGDLVGGDYNAERDIFVLHLRAGDTDGDGMDDDWEMAYFGTLARDGSGDFDGDGMTDKQEFLAGTDPTNRGSVLRVMTLTSPGRDRASLLWPAVPGILYQAQYKDDLGTGSWNNLPGPISVTAGTATVVDPTAASAPHRFYRVLVLPPP